MIIIGLSGKKGSGKNTFSTLLRQYIISPSVELAFADELKDDVAKICGVTRHTIETDKDDYRLLLQALGMYKRQRNGKDYWVEKLLKKIIALDSSIQVALITDLRFLNEATYLKEVGAMLVRVDRVTETVSLCAKHQSEVELDDFKFDRYIDNTRSLAELNFTAQQLAEQINNMVQKQYATNTSI